MPEWIEGMQLMFSWLMLATVCVAILAGIRLTAVQGFRLLSPARQRAVPWSGPVIVVIGFLVLFFVPALVHQVLSLVTPRDWAALWTTIAAFPLNVVIVLLVTRHHSGARLYQLGLTRHRCRENVALGCLAWLAFSPLVLGLNLLITAALSRWLNVRPEEHPLVRLLRDQPNPGAWILLLASALVAAPFLEELLFRGLVLRWLTRHRGGAGWVVAWALFFTMYHRFSHLLEGFQSHGWAGMMRESGPLAFVLVGAVGLLAVSSPGPRAVYASALLFGALHAFAWPTPIPLFVLGLVLGQLSLRTQSLVGPIIMHAMFNGVACVMLMTMPTQPPENGKAETVTGTRCPPTTISRAVPTAS